MTNKSTTHSATASRCGVRLRRSFSAACLVLLAVAAVASPRAIGSDLQKSPQTSGERPVIGIEHKGPIKVVFQITSDDMKEGVGKGLFYLRKLHASYLAAGIDLERLDIHAVYHGAASDHLLTDEAWNRVRGATTGNPNTALIAELAKRGVSVELCDTRRVANGWAKSDVHPDVALVSGAYQRIIDLQLRGYAYVRF